MKYGTSIARFSIKIAALNIFGRAHIQQFIFSSSESSYSAVICFQNDFSYKLCSRNLLKIFRTAFSEKKAGGTLLISFDC